jgi:acyl-ACP thioesterase
MIYQHDKKIGFFDLDANGNMRLTALIKYINDVSWYNAELLGAGMEETLKSGMVFILQRLGMQIFSLPKLDDLITIKTWPGEMTRSAFKRQGEILNSAGEKIIEWESLWVLIDVNERKIKRPTELPTEFPLYGRQGVGIEAEKIKMPVESKKLALYRHVVQYSELDMYGHMNSAIYADLVANVLSKIEKQRIKSMKKVQFNYVNEAKLNDEILIECSASGEAIHVIGTSGKTVVFTTEIK